MIYHNSRMEIEIRANTLYVLELMKKKLQQNNICIETIELDNIIWSTRKNCKTHSHHTKTIYY